MLSADSRSEDITITAGIALVTMMCARELPILRLSLSHSAISLTLAANDRPDAQSIILAISQAATEMPCLLHASDTYAVTENSLTFQSPSTRYADRRSPCHAPRSKGNRGISFNPIDGRSSSLTMADHNSKVGC